MSTLWQDGNYAISEIETDRVGLTVKADNSTDGITCESLLGLLREAQVKSNVVLSSTEKMLLVILERIVDGERKTG